MEPDISVICDPSRLDDRGCNGAPDLVIEIVSPSSRRMDYSTKNTLYSEAGVREYWIVDPAKERTTIYRYEEDAAPIFYLFSDDVPVGIFPGADHPTSLTVERCVEIICGHRKIPWQTAGEKNLDNKYTYRGSRGACWFLIRVLSERGSL